MIKAVIDISALLAMRPHTECFISRKAQASQCFKNFQRNTSIIMSSLVHCQLNCESLADSYAGMSYIVCAGHYAFLLLIARLVGY